MIEPVSTASAVPVAVPRTGAECRPPATRAATGDELSEPVLDSDRLFGRQRRLVIVHHGERYCLQVTRAGKLLLTK